MAESVECGNYDQRIESCRKFINVSYALCVLVPCKPHISSAGLKVSYVARRIGDIHVACQLFRSRQISNKESPTTELAATLR